MKRTTQPLATLALNVPPRHKLMVYVWPTLAAMRKNISKKSGKSERDARAFFHAPVTTISVHGRVINQVVGEIHLTKGRFGAGVFAHELQHFISWWCDIKNLEPMEKHWEFIPKLAGDLTNKFWGWFYEQRNLQ